MGPMMSSPTAVDDDPLELVTRLEAGDRRALARVLSRVENHLPLPPPPASPKPTLTVGITGSGGAGKSTLVAALIAHLRTLGLRVAVLASDPQSPLTGGALLGDRVRVPFPADDDAVYFRSLSTRGAAGGVSAATGPAIPWLRAAGFDVVLIETVGVGQDQIEVRRLVDVLLLMVTPHTGDEVQWEKAGLIEVADLVAVNKSDLAGSDRVRQQLRAALSLSASGELVPVLSLTAATGKGVPELWDTIRQCGEARRGE